jgi:hypothetical protein
MKMKQMIAGVLATVVCAWMCGCSKQEAAMDKTGAKPAEQTGTDLGKTVDTVKTAAQHVATEVVNQAKAAGAEAQGIIDSAKSLFAEQKYTEALAKLNQVTNLKLTSEQQSLVDDLKAKIQAAVTKAATSEATSALGNALGGKK